jgi:hypothetical protein
MIFCLKCGSKRVKLWSSADQTESTCKECGFRLDVDLDGWESDKYWRLKVSSECFDVPKGCLLVMSWECEE